MYVLVHQVGLLDACEYNVLDMCNEGGDFQCLLDVFVVIIAVLLDCLHVL